MTDEDLKFELWLKDPSCNYDIYDRNTMIINLVSDLLKTKKRLQSAEDALEFIALPSDMGPLANQVKIEKLELISRSLGEQMTDEQIEDYFEIYSGFQETLLDNGQFYDRDIDLILSLICELRKTKFKLNQESIQSDMRAEQRDGLSRENISIIERLRWAEESLIDILKSTHEASIESIARGYFVKFEPLTRDGQIPRI